MTNSETPDSGTTMDDPAAVTGSMNLNINLPEGVYLATGQPETPTPASGIATGTVVTFAGRTAPTGWLLCNGAAISRTTYADLFAVIGTDYGVGNANTTFNLPDLRGRYPLGKDDMGGVSADRVTAAEADVLGNSGGAEKHTLTTAELPSHDHGVDNPPNHVRGPWTGFWLSAEAGQWELRHHTDVSGGPRVDFQRQTADTGGGEGHDNMPPWQTLNYIIKT